MQEKEIWKDIQGYEGLYQVSNLGNVKNKIQPYLKQEKIYKKFSNSNGYLFVGLRKDKKRKFKYIHRLVAEAFIPNPNNLLQINHKDENKQNNCVNNLEWCTNKYNQNYGTIKERKKNSYKIKNNYLIAQYDKNMSLIKFHNSFREIERKLKYDHCAISRCCKNKQKTSYGYVWRIIKNV